MGKKGHINLIYEVGLDFYLSYSLWIDHSHDSEVIFL